MKNLRKLGLALITALLGVGALGVTVPAHAVDTSWGCPACKTSHN